MRYIIATSSIEYKYAETKFTDWPQKRSDVSKFFIKLEEQQREELIELFVSLLV